MIGSGKNSRFGKIGGSLDRDDGGVAGQRDGLNLNDKGFLSPSHLQVNYSGLPGWGGSLGADVFVCPRCGYQWRRNFVGDLIPECPKCHGKLIPVPVPLSAASKGKSRAEKKSRSKKKK